MEKEYLKYLNFVELVITAHDLRQIDGKKLSNATRFYGNGYIVNQCEICYYTVMFVLFVVVTPAYANVLISTLF